MFSIVSRGFRQAPNWISVQPPPHADVGTPAPDPWDMFATTVLQIRPASVVSIFERFPRLFEHKTFQEPFEDCADRRWLDRYAGSRSARDEMERHKERIAAALPPAA